MRITQQSDEIENTQPALLRFTAGVISYLFHPLFIPLYVGYFLMFIHPGYFAGYSVTQKFMLLARIGYVMVFFPLVTVLLLKAVGFIESVMLHTQKDRIIPYIASGIFFFWAYLVFRNQPSIPGILTAFTFSVFISSSAALMANIYFKTSMHAIGMGGVIGVFLVIMQSGTMLMTVPLSVAFLLTGLVCTSRLLISNHTSKEIYGGLIIGILCQVVAAVVI